MHMILQVIFEGFSEMPKTAIRTPNTLVGQVLLSLRNKISDVLNVIHCEKAVVVETEFEVTAEY